MVSWVSSGITALRLRYLKTIDDICRKDSMGLVVPMDVEAEMGLKPKLAKVMMRARACIYTQTYTFTTQTET